MIFSEELRRGNLVNTNNPHVNPFKVDTIEGYKVGGVGNISNFVYWYCEDIDPILLTEEWLLKLGLHENFYSSSNGLRYNLPNNSFTIHQLDDDGECPIIFEGNTLAYVRSVHQLQNLYFAITGEELTIKETV